MDEVDRSGTFKLIDTTLITISKHYIFSIGMIKLLLLNTKQFYLIKKFACLSRTT